uniref:Uncharacterized protein n=1 Tax=Globisporangium ultimum (strain ATCC 200006 / CBS 805.95 / DAOM BR144) TaxID=431595 RepID=K3X7M4_GLOUD
RTCSRPKNTLTFECNALCTTTHPCLITDEALYDNADSDHQCGVEALSNFSTCVITISDPCHYECFKFAESLDLGTTYPNFTFFIPYGTYKSKQEKQLATSSSAWADDVAAFSKIVPTDFEAWKNNDKLQIMDAMVLADTCTDVNIIGGSTEQSIKGKVANVVFATNLLSNNTFVT